MKTKHKIQIKVLKRVRLTFFLFANAMTVRQLTLKWLSGARAQDKNKQYF